MADPTIIDTADTTTAKLAQLKARGIDTIIRYDHRQEGSWKQVHPEEARAIAAAGMKLGIVYEGPGSTPGYFNHATGIADASYSLMQAPLRGQPKGSAVYFAVDFDPTSTQITNGIVPYFAGVSDVFRGEGYRFGAYCSGLCASKLKAFWPEILIWITCSLGFAGSRAAIQAGAFDLFQGQLSPLRGRCDEMLAGLSVDYNTPKSPSWDWGAFVPWGDEEPVPMGVHDAEWLQVVLADAGLYRGAIDGDVGPLTIAAMIKYIELQEK